MAHLDLIGFQDLVQGCVHTAETPSFGKGQEGPESGTAHRGVRVLEGAIEPSLQRELRDTGKNGQSGDVGRGIGASSIASH